MKKKSKHFVTMQSGLTIPSNHQKATQALDELAGSVKLPDKYKNKPLHFIIQDATAEYFANKTRE